MSAVDARDNNPRRRARNRNSDHGGARKRTVGYTRGRSRLYDRADFDKSVSDGDVMMCLDAADDAFVSNLITIVEIYGSDEGITPHIKIGSEVLRITGFLEANNFNERMIPVVRKIIRDIFIVGYSTVVVNQKEPDPEKRIVVLDPLHYDLRWQEDLYGRTYAAFPLSNGGGHTSFAIGNASGGGGTGMGDATAGGVTLDSSKSIPGALVLVAKHPDSSTGCITSLVRQIIPILVKIKGLQESYEIGDRSRNNPIMYLETAPSIAETKVPFLFDGLGGGLAPDGESMPVGTVNVGPSSHIVQAYEAASAKMKELRARMKAGSLDPKALRQVAAPLHDRRIVSIPAGQTIARDPCTITPDAAGTINMIDYYRDVMAQTMGIPPTLLKMQGGGAHNITAGVEESRRQIAVMIQSLHSTIMPFLSDVVLADIGEILADILTERNKDKAYRRLMERSRESAVAQELLESLEVEEKGGKVVGRNTNQDEGDDGNLTTLLSAIGGGKNPTPRKRKRERDDSSEGEGNEKEKEETFSSDERPTDDYRRRMSKRFHKENADRITIRIVANNKPFMSYVDLRQLYADLVIKENSFLHNAAKITGLRESEINFQGKKGPYHVVVEPQLIAAESAREDAENTRVTTEQAEVHGKEDLKAKKLGIEHEKQSMQTEANADKREERASKQPAAKKKKTST